MHVVRKSLVSAHCHSVNEQQKRGDEICPGFALSAWVTSLNVNSDLNNDTVTEILLFPPFERVRVRQKIGKKSSCFHRVKNWWENIFPHFAAWLMIKSVDSISTDKKACYE